MLKLVGQSRDPTKGKNEEYLKIFSLITRIKYERRRGLLDYRPAPEDEEEDILNWLVGDLVRGLVGVKGLLLQQVRESP
jgi:hypothetical protein